MFLIYARVSTVDQASDNATSLDEQERKGRAIAVLRGAGPYDIATYVDRGISGSIKLDRRPFGQQLMLDVKPGDVVIASKLDRLFRSATDAMSTVELFREAGIHLILADMGTDPVTGNGTARMFFGMLALVAEFERERINERTEDGRRAKRAKHGHLGGSPPFGYEVIGHGRDARLQVKPAEQEIVVQVKDLLKRHTPASACREAERLGLRDRAGSPFRIGQLQRIAEREVHV